MTDFVVLQMCQAADISRLAANLPPSNTLRNLGPKSRVTIDLTAKDLGYSGSGSTAILTMEPWDGRSGVLDAVDVISGRADKNANRGRIRFMLTDAVQSSIDRGQFRRFIDAGFFRIEEITNARGFTERSGSSVPVPPADWENPYVLVGDRDRGSAWQRVNPDIFNLDPSLNIADANLQRGGLHSVKTIKERDEIQSLRRRAGMIVFVEEDSTYYQLGKDLTNEHWRLFNAGGEPALPPISVFVFEPSSGRNARNIFSDWAKMLDRMNRTAGPKTIQISPLFDSKLEIPPGNWDLSDVTLKGLAGLAQPTRVIIADNCRLSGLSQIQQNLLLLSQSENPVITLDDNVIRGVTRLQIDDGCVLACERAPMLLLRGQVSVDLRGGSKIARGTAGGSHPVVLVDEPTSTGRISSRINVYDDSSVDPNTISNPSGTACLIRVFSPTAQVSDRQPEWVSLDDKVEAKVNADKVTFDPSRSRPYGHGTDVQSAIDELKGDVDRVEQSRSHFVIHNEDDFRRLNGTSGYGYTVQFVGIVTIDLHASVDLHNALLIGEGPDATTLEILSGTSIKRVREIRDLSLLCLSQKADFNHKWRRFSFHRDALLTNVNCLTDGEIFSFRGEHHTSQVLTLRHTRLQTGNVTVHSHTNLTVYALEDTVIEEDTFSLEDDTSHVTIVVDGSSVVQAQRSANVRIRNHDRPSNVFILWPSQKSSGLKLPGVYHDFNDLYCDYSVTPGLRYIQVAEDAVIPAGYFNLAQSTILEGIADRDVTLTLHGHIDLPDTIRSLRLVSEVESCSTLPAVLTLHSASLHAAPNQPLFEVDSKTPRCVRLYDGSYIGGGNPVFLLAEDAKLTVDMHEDTAIGPCAFANGVGSTINIRRFSFTSQANIREPLYLGDLNVEFAEPGLINTLVIRPALGLPGDANVFQSWPQMYHAARLIDGPVTVQIDHAFGEVQVPGLSDGYYDLDNIMLVGRTHDGHVPTLRIDQNAKIRNLRDIRNLRLVSSQPEAIVVRDRLEMTDVTVPVSDNTSLFLLSDPYVEDDNLRILLNRCEFPGRGLDDGKLFLIRNDAIFDLENTRLQAHHLEVKLDCKAYIHKGPASAVIQLSASQDERLVVLSKITASNVDLGLVKTLENYRTVEQALVGLATSNRSVVFAPGAPITDGDSGVFTTWRKLMSAVDKLASLQTIYINSQHGAAVIPAGTWNFRGAKLCGTQIGSAVNIDGGIFQNLRGIERLHVVGTFTDLSKCPIIFTRQDGVFEIGDHASIICKAPLIKVTFDASLNLLIGRNTGFDGSCIFVEGNGSLDVHIEGFTVIPHNMISTDTGTVRIDVSTPAALIAKGVTGTISYLAQAENIGFQPSPNFPVKTSNLREAIEKIASPEGVQRNWEFASLLNGWRPSPTKRGKVKVPRIRICNGTLQVQGFLSSKGATDSTVMDTGVQLDSPCVHPICTMSNSMTVGRLILDVDGKLRIEGLPNETDIALNHVFPIGM